MNATPHDRRSFLALAGGAAAGTVALSAVPGSALARPGAHPHAPDPQAPRQLRAMWIASVVNIDWPSAQGLDRASVEAEYRGWLDLAQRLRLNAVIVQVRPTADAFWDSPYEPWSEYLTGTQGQDPGWDPMAFLVEETHARDLELHAWFNPYRVSMQPDPAALAADHPARVHPDWVWAYGPKLYYDPGVPEVRRFVQDAMLDAVARYDVDGVHFDDYFYPYPIEGEELPDAATFATYGGGFDDVGDWRRDNVDRLVQEMGERVHALKPWVKFGVSPFGIWRNDTSDPLGSATAGTESYEGNYADTRRWVKEGWVDYVNPQVYWQIGLEVADYAALVPWWADVVSGTDVQLWIGQATYKATSGVFTDPAELSNHLTFNEAYPEVDGDVWFSAKDVRADAAGSTSLVVADHYARPALVPTFAQLPVNRPRPPERVRARRGSDGTRVTWSGGARPGHGHRRPGHGEEARATSYAVYRGDARGRSSAPGEWRLLGTVRATDDREQTFLDAEPATGVHPVYVVTGLDRLWNEGPASRPARA